MDGAEKNRARLLLFLEAFKAVSVRSIFERKGTHASHTLSADLNLRRSL